MNRARIQQIIKARPSLEQIRKHKIREVDASKNATPIEKVWCDAEKCETKYPVNPFRFSLENSLGYGYGLIAEIKYASPSKGTIREDDEPPQIARAYEAGGAACLSVLTDISFGGFPAYLTKARNACQLPILCKDFMVDPYQVARARSWGADCILIIMAMVDDACAAELEKEASRWNMDVLVEVHTATELERAKKLQSKMIGINNRNLNTFNTSLDVTRTLAKLVPTDCLIVSASGLSKPEHLADMARHGARCFLVGEALMRQPDVEAATRALLAAPQTEDSP